MLRDIGDLYNWFATTLHWTPRQVDELELWEAAKIMGADSREENELEDIRRRMAEQRHTMPDRISRYRDIKSLRAEQAKTAAERRREAGRKIREGKLDRPKPRPDIDITDQVRSMLPK